MKMYRFKPDAKDQIERSGHSQADIARIAKYDYREMNKRLLRGGNVRPATANRIARAYAEVAHVSHDQALQLLFEEIIVERAEKPTLATSKPR